jgi:hypothetical protein
MATISQLQSQVLGRVEENVESGPVFWSLEFEINSGLQEAQCDLMLMLGRPDLIVSVPFTIQPNTPWQQVPKGVFCITNIQGPASEVWKVSLQDLDYAQVAGPDWEQDIGDTVTTWFPLGLNMFGVHPCVAQPQTVLITGIKSPIQGIWPYDGSQNIVFADQDFVELEKYAAAYCRLKEGGAEQAEGAKLYAEYLKNAQRLTQIQSRIDPLMLDNGATGSRITANPTTQR